MTSAKIKLNATSGGGSVSLEAPSSTTSNADIELKLPVADGSADTFLKTNGSGQLSFAEAGGGKILQVKQTVKTDTFSSTTTGSDVDITGLSVSITPSATTSKILVTYDTNISGSNAGYSGNIHLKRGSTKIYQGDADGSRTRSTQFFITRNDTIGHLEEIKVHGQFLDSPNTTSATTYKISVNAINTNVYVNRTLYDSNASGVARYPSSITVMEVAA